MLALVYLIISTWLADSICRRCLRFKSIQHRFAAAFLTGILISASTTYLLALAFSFTGHALAWANPLFLLLAIGGIYLLRNASGREPGDGSLGLVLSSIGYGNNTTQELVIIDAPGRPSGNARWDLAVFAIVFVFSVWLVTSNLSYGDESYRFSVKSWSDYGPHISLAQSFALGNNFPTEHPFFPGEIIRYHFLFWFYCANLSYLGLNLIWAINLVSLMALLSLLVLVATLAELIFGARVPGRIATVLFFFASSSLSYIPFIMSRSGPSDLIHSVLNHGDYLKSGYPYWGDTWGALTVAVYANQRHLIVAIGILLVVMIAFIDQFRENGLLGDRNEEVPGTARRPWIRSAVFSGLLVGAMPYFNSAVFVSALILLGCFLMLFAARRELAISIAIAVLIGAPQALLLRAGQISPTGESLFHWGYTVTDPTIAKVLEYIGWTFGFKWILLAMAFWLGNSGQRKLLLAFTSLVPVVFAFRLSTDAFNNHKLLNIWIVLTSVYVAFALWQIAKGSILRTTLAVALAIATSLGAAIDLMPLQRDSMIKVPANDRLTRWLLENTAPNSVFISDRLLSHPIIFTGRRAFLGNTYFLWTAGYRVTEREALYKRIFQERDLATLIRLLNENKIDYVAIDNEVRRNGYVLNPNEPIFQRNFQLVYHDMENKYGNLTIYEVPAMPDQQP